RERLPHLVAADLLDLCGEVEKAHVDAALGELGEQDIGHLAELELVVCKERDNLLFQLDRRRRALEVEARADLLAGLVDGVLHLDEVGVDDGVEAGHFANLSAHRRSHRRAAFGARILPCKSRPESTSSLTTPSGCRRWRRRSCASRAMPTCAASSMTRSSAARRSSSLAAAATSS